MKKHCRKCGLDRDHTEFYRNNKSKDGLQSNCKDCQRAMKESAPDRKYRPDAIKRCPMCKELKRGTEYYNTKGAKFGLSYSCKECTKATTAHYEEKNAQNQTIPERKECAHCKEDKPSSEFYRRRQSKDGLYVMCKPCWSEYRNQRRQKV